jgi:hypothetical protein
VRSVIIASALSRQGESSSSSSDSVYNRDLSIIYEFLSYGYEYRSEGTTLFFISAFYSHNRSYVDFAAKIHHQRVILRWCQVEKYSASANGRILSTKKGVGL